MEKSFNSTSFLLAFLLSGITILMACGDDPVEGFDPDGQRLIDQQLIQDYLLTQNYNRVDTTANGVYYSVLNSGQGTDISLNDIVSLDYVGRLLDGFVFDTSIDTVAANNGFYDSTRTYQPIVFTYTATGWTLNSFVPGFKEGVTATMKHMNLGGHSVIIMPSELGYGNNFSSNLRNEVLIFDLYPVYVR